MEEIINCDTGEEVDPLSIVTVIYTIELTSSTGHKRYFLRNRQYLHSGTSRKYVQCAGCGVTFSSNQMIHYHVEVEGEGIYYLPEEIVAIEGTLLPKWRQDKYKYWEHKSDEPKDYRKAVKETMGIDIKKGMQQQPHDGYEFWLRAQREKNKNKGKRYGRVEIDREECDYDD